MFVVRSFLKREVAVECRPNLSHGARGDELSHDGVVIHRVRCRIGLFEVRHADQRLSGQRPVGAKEPGVSGSCDEGRAELQI